MENRLTKADNEYNQLMKILHFRFPHSFKKWGIIFAILLFCFLIICKFFGSNELIVKDLCRLLMLASLLVASLSKEAFEDELVQHIRFQSYMLAFISVTVYTILIPLISMVMDALITKITSDGTVKMHEFSSFEIIFMLVCFQILFLAVLKKLNCAQ